jgi:4-hydroxy-2-oxoheptanedioate aldolase
LLEAFGEIVQAAASAGKRAGIFCVSPAYAARMAALGFGLVTAGSDTGLLSQAAATACEQARKEAKDS